METKFERWLGQVVVAFLAALVLLIFAADALPDVPVPSCSCTGKDNCEIATFHVDGERRAYCALSSGRETCCMIEAKDKYE